MTTKGETLTRSCNFQLTNFKLKYKNVKVTCSGNLTRYRIDHTPHLGVDRTRTKTSTVVRRLTQVPTITLNGLIKAWPLMVRVALNKRLNLKAKGHTSSSSLKQVKVTTLDRETNLKATRFIGRSRRYQCVQLRGTVSAQLDGVVPLHTLMPRDHCEAVCVAHRRHTAHPPLTHSIIGIFFSGMTKDSVEPLHVVMVNTGAKVTTGKGGDKSSRQGYDKRKVRFTNHAVRIEGIRPNLTSDTLWLVRV